MNYTHGNQMNHVRNFYIGQVEKEGEGWKEREREEEEEEEERESMYFYLEALNLSPKIASRHFIYSFISIHTQLQTHIYTQSYTYTQLHKNKPFLDFLHDFHVAQIYTE